MTPALLPQGPVFTRDQAVYVLHVPALGYFKVGRAKEPEWRVGELQCGCPEKLELLGSSQIDESGLSAVRFETSMHKALASYRSHGEWFACPSVEVVYEQWRLVWNGLVQAEQRAKQ